MLHCAVNQQESGVIESTGTVKLTQTSNKITGELCFIQILGQSKK